MSEGEINQSKLDAHSNVWSDKVFWADIKKREPCGAAHCVFTLCYLVAFVFWKGSGKKATSQHRKATVSEKARVKCFSVKCWWLGGPAHHFGPDFSRKYSGNYRQLPEDGSTWLFTLFFFHKTSPRADSGIVVHLETFFLFPLSENRFWPRKWHQFFAGAEVTDWGWTKSETGGGAT